jgi:hypothetical protein
VIRPSSRWDWWQIPLEWVKALPAGIPGVLARNDGTFEVHRTHLPLLVQRGFDLGLPGALAGVPPRGEAPHAPPANMPWRPWQKRALDWAAPRQGSMIVAEPRMGKSRAALALHDPARGPLGILAPLDVRQVWIDAIESMFPGAEVFCMEGRKPDVEALKTSPFIFGHYDIARDQQLTNLRIGTLIVDEAHLLANDKSRRSEGVRDFAVLAKRVVVLTGTPLWNSTKGLWPLLATANPGAWGKTSFGFKQRYCAPTQGEYGWVYGEISNEEEWHARRAEVVFQADWATERPDLPPIARRFVDVPIDAAGYGELDIAVEAMRDATLDDTTIGAIGRYRKLTGKLKIAAVADELLAYREPTVAWCWHKADVAKPLAKAIKERDKHRPVFMIHGDESPQKRLAAMAAWRDTPDGVLIATLAVGQVGIDLSHAKVAAFVEVDWTPAVLYQAAMRTFTPDRAMTLLFFRVEHPVEQLLVDKLTTKLARGAASSMPAAGSGFDLSTSPEDARLLLSELEALLLGGSR